jgi:predicted GIY-YIG superfamily endonuclease
VIAGYIGDVLDEAKRYAEHRTNEGDDVKMNKDDVRLAVQAKVGGVHLLVSFCS